MRIFTSILTLVTAFVTFAFEYPEMYVTGSFDNWGIVTGYKLSRDGNRYSVTVPSLDGAFKVTSEKWTYNYGSASTISGTCSVDGELNGANMTANNLTDVTISYTFNVDDRGNMLPTRISFQLPGDTPVIDEPVYPNTSVSGTLPVLYINVYADDNTTLDNEIISRNLSHKNYFKGEYWLEGGDLSIASKDEPLPLEIKARGNFTRTAFAKKPFKLKLGTKQSMLGLTKSKHFALLAHADDNFGYLRNFTGFNLGKRIGLPWTPWQQPVEVVINGDYRGLYFLTESIRIESSRVNITELPDLCEDNALISGGYLVELDNYDETNQISMEEKSFVGGYTDRLRITWDTPENYSALQQQFVTDQFTAMNNLTGKADPALWSYIDIDDAVRYYIVEEIISHTEAFHGSTYMYRDYGANQKWHFSPLWDCGNAFNGSTEMFFYHNSPFGNTWIPSFRAQTTFNSRLSDTWKWFMSTCYAGIEADINQYVATITEAAKADRKRWKDAPRPDATVSMDVVDNSDMTAARDRVVAHLKAKTAWLARQWGEYSAPTAEPARDITPAAPLPDYATPSGIYGPTISQDADTDVAPKYYDLRGLEISHPVKGQIYIKVSGSKAEKIRL